jgi:hypothetical protein
MTQDYVHGYSERESARLIDQAVTLTEFLHIGTAFPPGSRVLEAGRGVGAQTLTLIEGDHGSTCFHPDSTCARRAIQCLIDLQARTGGDSLIGRRLYPMLVSAGLRDVLVVPKLIYVDASRPELIEGFTRSTFTAMVEGVREQALERGLIDLETWEQGIADLHRTADADGTFCYTFFKGIGTN